MGPYCRKIHYGKQAEAISEECERAKAEVKEIASKEKCRNLEKTGFCKYGSICKFSHARESKTGAVQKERTQENKGEREGKEKQRETTDGNLPPRNDKEKEK